jgi:hypothetical protein
MEVEGAFIAQVRDENVGHWEACEATLVMELMGRRLGLVHIGSSRRMWRTNCSCSFLCSVVLMIIL